MNKHVASTLSHTTPASDTNEDLEYDANSGSSRRINRRTTNSNASFPDYRPSINFTLFALKFLRVGNRIRYRRTRAKFELITNQITKPRVDVIVAGAIPHPFIGLIPITRIKICPVRHEYIWSMLILLHVSNHLYRRDCRRNSLRHIRSNRC